MKLKNKLERKAFIENYQFWGVWKDISELGIKLYRYEFENKDSIVVTEYTRNAERYISTSSIECKYHLLLDDNSQFNDFEPNRSFKHYEPNGVSIGTIIDYLTKRRDYDFSSVKRILN